MKLVKLDKKILVIAVSIGVLVSAGYYAYNRFAQNDNAKATAWTSLWYGTGARSAFKMYACKLPMDNSSPAGGSYKWRVSVVFTKSQTYPAKYYYGAASSYSAPSVSKKLQRKTSSSWWNNHITAVENLAVESNGYVRSAIKTKKRGTYLSSFKSIKDIARCDEI